ncbi:MAG: aminoacyl-tRNA hydrolase [Candidatus Caenarcaniphilales bacterium]|jgi:PTH1 family peptidyl-tRNA hydrolase|nr:aminoacyl-tRNA hydrolase [Candidatus Caenarcaniphilales bacterium]
MSTDKFVIGLGNPGDKYDGTRHNIGFELVDALAQKAGLEWKSERKFHSHVATKIIKIKFDILQDQVLLPANTEFKLFLVKPQTFMNNSGKAVLSLMNFYKFDLTNLMIIHDDVTLDTGKTRIAFDRGAGGQHGIEDTINRLGGRKDFNRLKLGVGPDPGGEERGDYVLERFPEEQIKEIIEPMISSSLDCVLKWLTGHKDLQQVRNLLLE